MTLDRTSYQGETIGVELPVTVDLTVVETEPGFAGDTQTGARKPATTETGLIVHGADLRRARRHDPDRHPDRGIPDPGLAMPMSRSRAAGLGTAELGCGPRPRPLSEPAATWRPVGSGVRTRRRQAPGTFGVRILGVSEVTRAIRGAVRSDPRLADLWVEGEIGRVTISSAGHAYFALKDERNQLQCVWFRDDRLRSAFEAQAGLRVVAHGRIDLFEPQGALQLYVESIQPAGLGDLTLRFEALKARLAAEGLFDAARKRPLPTPPGDDRGHHEPDRRGVEGHLPRPRPALAADPGRPRRGAGAGRCGAGQPGRRVPQGRALCRLPASPRADPTRRRR